MRIVKLGRPEHEVEKTIDCNRCKSTIGFVPNDTKGEYRHSSYNNCMTCYIDCPVCKNLIYVTISCVEYAWINLKDK